MSHGGPHADPHDPLQKKIAIAMAVYAVLLTFNTMLTNEARTESLLKAAQATNQWSYFQSKSTKQVVVKAEADLLENLGVMDEPKSATPVKDEHKKTEPKIEKVVAPVKDAKGDVKTEGVTPAGGEAAVAMTGSKLEIAKNKLEADAERYETEKDKIKEQAEEITKDGEHAEKQEHWYEYACTAVELGVVLASVALLLNSKSMFYGSAVLAALSLVITAFTAVMLH
jgi:hypothetical protein